MGLSPSASVFISVAAISEPDRVPLEQLYPGGLHWEVLLVALASVIARGASSSGVGMTGRISHAVSPVCLPQSAGLLAWSG